MKARTLQEVMRIFDPFRPLDGVELKRWYIDRPKNPSREIKIYLQGMGLQDKPVHILFTGHDGSGKSTELNRLALDLKNQFLGVRLSLRVPDLTYVDLPLYIATSLFQRVTKPDVLGRAPADTVKGILTDISQFIEKVFYGAASFRAADRQLELSVKVSLLALELQTQLTNEPRTRERIRQRLEPHLEELIGRINQVVELVRARCGRSTLLLVECPDNLDQSQASDIFVKHGPILAHLCTSTIYTFPIRLRDSRGFLSVMDRFKYFMLPNLNVTTRSNSLNLLSKAITLRMKEGLISDSACCRIAKASGGLMRTLIRLVRAAAVEAIVARHESIAEEDALAAEKEERAAFIPNLRQEDYQTLRRCHTEKRLLSADDAVLDLLYRRALLEYPNDEPWCDVNPVLLPTVLERTSDKELTRYGSLPR